MGRRIAIVAMGVILATLAAAAAALRPDRALQAGAGVAAHHLCASTFVSGQPPRSTFDELVRPLTGPVAGLIRYRLDRAAGIVEAHVGPFTHALARFTPGYGCRLDYASNLPAPPPLAAPPPAAVEAVAAPADPVIAAALGRVFAERPGAKPKRVKAVVVLQDGRIVAERYAPGFGPQTPLLSYSVAKSFTNALLGVLVRQGRLRVDQPVGAPEWSRAGDPRAKLTLEDLLRMQSGLDAEETGSGFDPASHMLYAEPDMAAFSTRHPLRRPPRTEWDYTSCDTLILDRVLRDAVGGGAAGMRAFAQRELFQPLGLADVTLEFDGAGTFAGSAHVYAPARAYARFGELFRRDGLTADGRRVLPPGWVAWSRRSTLGAPYGAGFWTNDGPSRFAAQRVAAGFPKDGFFASGNLGQRIYIAPSAGLVVARFGYSAPPDFGIADDMALIAAAIAAHRASLP